MRITLHENDVCPDFSQKLYLEKNVSSFAYDVQTLTGIKEIKWNWLIKLYYFVSLFYFFMFLKRVHKYF